MKKKLALGTSFLIILISSSAPQATAADVNFGTQVYPILKENCLQCHSASYVDARSGRKKKPKGGLRLDTYDWIMKGYEDDDKNVAVVIPGQPEESTFYTSTTLPEDHDDIMPPKGDLLTKAQQGILKQWVAQGAKSNGFKAPVYVNPKAKK